MPSIRDIYADIEKSADPAAALQEQSFEGFSAEQIAAIEGSSDKSFYRGKVRDLIIEKDKITIAHSDRLTAFDRYISLVPYKGAILSRISEFWLDQAKQVIPTHLLGVKDNRTLRVKRTSPVKVEVVVRQYLAGHLAREYAKGEREICGVPLPEGLEPNAKLPEPIITPTTKADVGDHDMPITVEGIIEQGLCTEKEWETISTSALKLFALGTEINAKHDLILVDTKYEFGRDTDGQIILIDELHTPDSSRFWKAKSYEESGETVMLDKEVVRRWLLEQGFSGEGEVPEVPVTKLLELGRVYLDVAETLVGTSLSI